MCVFLRKAEEEEVCNCLTLEQIYIQNRKTQDFFYYDIVVFVGFIFRKKDEEQPLLEDEKVVTKQAVPTSADELSTNSEGL